MTTAATELNPTASYFALLASSTRKNATETCHGIVSGEQAATLLARSARPELLRFALCS